MRDPQQKQFYQELGARIRELRGSSMSQEELAKRIGLKRTSIVNIEAGEQKVLVHNLLSIAKALGVRSTAILAEFEHYETDRISIPSNSEGGIRVAVGQWVARTISKANNPAKPYDSSQTD